MKTIHKALPVHDPRARDWSINMCISRGKASVTVYARLCSSKVFKLERYMIAAMG